MNQYNDLKFLDRSSLEAAKANFFASGGKIKVLELPKFEPRPQRIEPQLTQEEIELRQIADQIRTLSATMFKLEMSKTLGISQERIAKICKQFGIKLSNGSGKKPNSKGAYAIDPEEDKRLVERLRALAEVGVTKHKARAQVDIGWHKLRRLIEQYKIPFPGCAN